MDVHTLRRLPEWEWPPEAADLLVEVLGDKDHNEYERHLATELASALTVMNDDIAGALLEVVRSPGEAESLRGTAAIALGPLLEDLDSGLYDDEPEDAPVSEEVAGTVRDALRETYREGDAPKYVRRRVLEASVRAPEEWHRGAIRAACHSGDPEWLRTAVFCMGYVPGFENEILAALESDDLALLYDALRAARFQGVLGAWPTVRSLLRSPGTDRELLLMAISAVVTVRPEEADEVLGPFLDSEDEEVADAARYALELVDRFADELFAESDLDDPSRRR